MTQDEDYPTPLARSEFTEWFPVLDCAGVEEEVAVVIDAVIAFGTAVAQLIIGRIGTVGIVAVDIAIAIVVHPVALAGSLGLGSV